MDDYYIDMLIYQKDFFIDLSKKFKEIKLKLAVVI